MSTTQFVYEGMARFIRAKYPNAVLDSRVVKYKGRLELAFLPYPKADPEKPFTCVLVSGHDFKIVKEF